MKTKTIVVAKDLFRAGIAEKSGEGKTRLSVSSSEPYLRYDWYADEEYYEVLRHTPDAIDLSRLKAGAALLYNHDRDIHLGRIESPTIEGGRLYVMAQLSEADDVRGHITRVKEGILRDTSVGYNITGDGTCIGAKDGKPVYEFPWAPHEASFVTIAADITVGAGRDNKEDSRKPHQKIIVNGLDILDGKSHTTPTLNQPTPVTNMDNPPNPPLEKTISPADIAAAGQKALNEHRERVRKIKGFVDGLKDHPVKAWHAEAVRIGEVHMDGDANFEAFHEEVLRAFPKPKALTSGIESIEDCEQEPKRKLTPGAQFINSRTFQDFAPLRGQERRIVAQTDMSLLGIRGKMEMATRAGFNSVDLAAINVAPQSQLVGLGLESLTVLDLISPGTTSAAAIPYPKETTLGTLDGVALTTGLPRAGMVGERGTKPTWEPDITTDTAAVKKIAVVTKVPDEFLADFPGFQSFLDARLPAMVNLKAEEQVLYGDGVGNNLKGIFTNAGVLTRAYATDWFTSIRKAITDVEVASFFKVDGIVMHPYDWEVASLEKDLNGQPLAGGPFYIPYGNGLYVEVRTFWGKRVVTTVACSVGRPLIGCWKLGAQYFMREGMNLVATNSNEDDFKKNLMAIRAEERLAVATYRPNCFMEITGGPARA